MSGTVWIGLCLLLGALILEIYAPSRLTEGFQALASVSASAPAANDQSDTNKQSTNILTNMITRRSDVGIGREQLGAIQDLRYFSGYADVQRYGMENDFCRMVTLSGEDGMMFTCALAGTKGSPISFRTITKKQGFRISRDDYMHDVIKDGRQAYCRILKMKDSTYQPMCVRSLDTRFHIKDEVDPDPPQDIMTLLDFYGGCAMWLRLRDDMLDYTNTAIIQYAGQIKIDQTPRPRITRGLHFNGQDQFIRLGDAADLSLGNVIKMRSVRAWSVWVKFNTFSNNAHIFDFGDGPGVNNTFLGILGKGDAGNDDGNLVRPPSECPETTVPDGPSGAQFCPELTPQELYVTSSANVDEYVCTDFEVLANKEDPIQTRPVKKIGVKHKQPKTATLQYEVWDQKLRKVQIKVNKVIPIKKWVHIVVTAKNADAMRPDLMVYANNKLVATQLQGFLPQAKVTSNNYLGKSNWANDFSGYELRDELFDGDMFDFRMYSSFLSESKIKRIFDWGSDKLGVSYE